MRRLLLILLCLGFSVPVWAQTIRIDVRGESLQSVLRSISDQSEYKFAFNSRSIDTSVKVSAKVASDSIDEVMTAVLQGIPIGYSVVGKQIALFAREETESAPAEVKPLKVSGIVTDEEGAPLEGAGVFVKGGSAGTVTNAEGRWSLEVPGAGSVLVVSYIGMDEMEVTVGNRTNLVLVMKTSTEFLNQVVVTGYQTLSRERSAGSFASVSGSAVRDQANIHGNVLRSLEGSAAGLNVTETADGVTYLIRGVSSINSKQEPLFIVDGVAMTREQMEKMVNPNDVESINFLKDATAASIWGAQAANGVIVVTTRKGKAGDLKICYNGSFTFKGKPDYSYMDMMTSEEFIQTAIEVFDPQTYKWSDVQNNTYGTGNDYRIILPHEYPLYQYYLGEISIDQRDAALSALAGTNGRKEYEKYFMSNAYLMNHSVSFSGGSEKSNFYVSLENQRTQGTGKDIEDEYRLFFRDGLKLSDRVNLDISAHLFYSSSRSYLSSYDQRSSLPYMSYYDADGKELSLTNYIMSEAYRESVEGITGISLAYYPVSDFLSNTAVSKTLGANANAGLTVRIADWLSYEGRFQYSLTNGTSESFLTPSSFGVRLERAQGTDMNGVQYLPSSGGHYTFASSSMSSYTVRNQLNLDRNLGKDGIHRLTGVAGVEFSSRRSGSNSTFMRGYDMQTMQYIFYDDYYLSRTGVKNPALPSFAAASTNTFDPNSYSQSDMEYRFVSMYANGAYTLKDKYSFNASVRVDQSNLFGSDPSVQFKPIWSAGAIWNLSKEDFMKGTSSWLNRLNLRASFGYAGNSPDPGQGGPYNILSSVSSANYSRFGLGYVVATPANDKLSWEKTRIINFGIDWAVLGNRLSGSIDLYDKNTTNMLGQAPVDPTTGFTTVLSNIGSMTNKGVEFTINSVNTQVGDFEWMTSFNFTYNRNKLVDMYVEPPKSPYRMIEYTYWKGYPYGTVFAYKWAGLDSADGMPRVYDSAGNIVRSITAIDTEDAVSYMGSTIPPVFGSLSNTLQWGDWDLSFTFIYNMGHVLRNDVNNTFSYRLDKNLHNDFSKRWKQPGDEARTNVPAYYSLKNTSINESDVLLLYRYADVNVLSASYIKLREVSLGYQIPESACKAVGVKSANARVQVSNLATIAFNGEGIDPEAFYFAGSRADRFRPFVSASLNVEF